MLAAAIAAVSMLSTPGGALMALLSAEQREYANNLVIGIQNAVVTFSSLLFALLHWGIPGQVAATLVGGAFLCTALAWLTRPTWRAARRAKRADSSTLTAFARLNRATFWRMLAGRMALMSDRVTIAIFLGGNTVTSFHGTVRLADAVFPHLGGIGNAAWPAMVDIHNRGDTLLFSKRLREVTTTICGAAVALAAPILTINRAFVDVWLGPGFFAGWTLTLASCINVALLATVSFWEWCFQCTQKVEAIIPVTAVACVANVVTSVAGTLLLGAPGPALGTSIAMLVIVVPWEISLLRQHFSVSWPGLVLAIVRPVALAIPYLLTCHWIGEKWPPTTWHTLALYAAASSGGWILIAWFTVFDKDTRGSWRARVARLLSRFR
jgi:O-antigen/teichoic acid export membrane protein